MFNKHLRFFLLEYKIILKPDTAEDTLKTDIFYFSVLGKKVLQALSGKQQIMIPWRTSLPSDELRVGKQFRPESDKSFLGNSASVAF